jgi:hypothetical protein
LLLSAAALVEGNHKYLKGANGRRALCATISDDCAGFDVERVRRFVGGGYTLGQLDADAHTRVVYGKCRSPFLTTEKALRGDFEYQTGGLSAVGIARSARGEKGVSIDDPTSYSLVTTYTRVSAGLASLAVAVALAIPETESYWRGVVGLAGVDRGAAASPWDTALVWLAQDKVARVMVRLFDTRKAADALQDLNRLYGPGATVGQVTKWSLPGGITAKLDLGTSAALTVEDPLLIGKLGGLGSSHQRPGSVGTSTSP